MDQSKEIKGIISRYYSSNTKISGTRNGAVHGSRPTMHIWLMRKKGDVDYDSWGSTCGLIAGREFGGNHLLSVSCTWHWSINTCKNNRRSQRTRRPLAIGRDRPTATRPRGLLPAAPCCSNPCCIWAGLSCPPKHRRRPDRATSASKLWVVQEVLGGDAWDLVEERQGEVGRTRGGMHGGAQW